MTHQDPDSLIPGRQPRFGLLEDYEWKWQRRKLYGTRRADRSDFSPQLLIQEMVRSNWEGVVGAILQQRTARAQAHPAAWELFTKYGVANRLANADLEDVSAIIRRCGFQNRRAGYLIDMSEEWLAGRRPTKPGEVTGCGEYVSQSYRVFALGDLSFEPEDLELRRYVDWRRRL